MTIEFVERKDLEVRSAALQAEIDDLEGRTRELRAAMDGYEEVIADLERRLAALLATDVRQAERMDTLAAGLRDHTHTPPPLPADVTVTVASAPYRIARTKQAITIVDNNLIFAGAEAQKAKALANLRGQCDHLNLFAESFGNGDNMLKSWNGTSDAVADLPQPDMALLVNHWRILDEKIAPATWGAIDYRHPWQLTGHSTDAGVTTRSVVADYNSDGRRLLTNKRPQYVEHTARWSSAWFGLSPKNRRIYRGSEFKNFQEVVQVVVDGVTLRANRNQSWDWDDYAGTPGRADMGHFAMFLAIREGLMEGARRAGVPWSQIKICTPYPVLAHQGSISEFAPNPSGAADAVTFNSLNDATGVPVDYSDINGAGSYPGYMNKAAAIATSEHIRLLAKHNIPASEFVLCVDFGTWNYDHILTPGLTDQEITYKRNKGIMAFLRKRLAQCGFIPAEVEIDIVEYYPKKMKAMYFQNENFVDPSLRQQAQASCVFAGYVACYEDGIEMPCRWSWSGRGGESSDSNDPNDPQQWDSGMLERTVTDNKDHAGSAVAGGGERKAVYFVVDALKTHFPPGTPLHAVTVSDARIRGLASPTHVALGNESPDALTVRVGAAVHSLTPLAVTVVPYP